MREVVEAANFMDIETLYASCCSAIAIKFKKAQIDFAQELAKTQSDPRVKEELKSGYLSKPYNDDFEEDERLIKEYAYIF